MERHGILCLGCGDVAEPHGPLACVGVFSSTAVDPGLDPVLNHSVLVIAWFQPLPDVPSGENADPALRGVPWEELARDHEF